MLANTLRCETTTPRGEPVEPEVYCSSAVLVVSAAGPCHPGGESRSSRSSSMTAGALPPTALMQTWTSPTTAEVVSTAAGAQSCSAAVTRSSWLPNAGTGNGTTMQPASMAPKNPAMYSRPCGASNAIRSPGEATAATSTATDSARRTICDQVRASEYPDGSTS